MPASEKTSKFTPELRRKAVVLAAKIGALFLIVYITFFRLYGLTFIDTDSMSPRISGGDLATIYRLDGEYKNGDVLLYEKDGRQQVGRVVALSGDTIDQVDGKFQINGHNEEVVYYGNNGITDISNVSYPYKVADKQVFVLGDNRDNQNDSRKFGAINYSEIKGRIIGVFRTNAI